MTKLERLLLLILTAAVCFVVWRQQKMITQIPPQQIGSALSYGALSQPQLQIQAPKTRLLALTLAIKATPQQLPEGKPLDGQFRVSAPVGNAGVIYVADSPASCSTGPRYSIAAGQSEEIHISNLAMLFYFGTLNDELSILSEVQSND